MKKTNINLLPTELAVRGDVKQAVKNLRRIVVVYVILFFFFGIAGASYLYYLSNQVKEISSESQGFKQQIKALEPTEQKIFLTKDRISKARSVLAGSSADGQFEKFDRTYERLPQNVLLEEAELKAGTSTVSFLVTSSADMVRILEYIKQSNLYERVHMESFDFNVLQGYTIDFELN